MTQKIKLYQSVKAFKEISITFLMRLIQVDYFCLPSLEMFLLRQKSSNLIMYDAVVRDDKSIQWLQ